MRNPEGYSCTTYDDGRVVENDTFKCKHCQFIVQVKPKCDPFDLGGLCRICNKMICPRCVKIGTCTPFEKQLEQQEARYHMLRSMGV